MWLAVEHLHTKVDAVYDVSVFYEGTVNTKTGRRRDAPQLVDFLLGHCKRVHIKVRRIPISAVPRTEEKFKPWLHEIFVEKDAMLRPFFTGVEDQNCQLASDTSKSVTNGSQLDEINSNESSLTSIPNSINSSGNLRKNSDLINYETISRKYGGRRSDISIMETFPSFLIFGASCVVMAWSPWTRSLYLSFLGYGTVGTYALLAIKSVC